MKTCQFAGVVKNTFFAVNHGYSLSFGPLCCGGRGAEDRFGFQQGGNKGGRRGI